VALEKLLATTRADAAACSGLGLDAAPGQSLAQLLRRPEVALEDLRGLAASAPVAEDTRLLLAPLFEAGPLPPGVRNELRAVETEIKYAGYLDQQRRSIEKLRRAEGMSIPDWFDYQSVSGLSREMQEKLTRVRPQTVGQASRIPGVTPAALSLIHVYIGIQGRRRSAVSPGGAGG
jgi:tRNA uridine 5-carboxymethylaminomethyl modification enzyme